jgi:16S rRNA (cytidine1402-2'-O)-methyltransferase
MDPATFTFAGFPPRTGRERTRVLEAAVAAPVATVFYEAPRRLRKTLESLRELAGGDRPVVVAREVTKLHEDFFRGTLEEAITYYADRAIRGEVVVILSPSGAPAAASDETDPAEVARALAAAGRPPTAIARELTRRLGIPRAEAYPIARSATAKPEGDPS